VSRAQLSANSTMIRLEDILTPGRSLVNVPGGSKKRVLEQIAHLLDREQPELDAGTIFEALIAREKLGSTGFGNGIAIPHCRMAGCTAPISALIRLDAAVDFDAIDAAPVDLLFVLLVPQSATDAHLELLRQIASMLDRDDVRARLRQAESNQALYQVVLDVQNGN
jgi:PTS system nitrogen regulatory IIA component